MSRGMTVHCPEVETNHENGRCVVHTLRLQNQYWLTFSDRMGRPKLNDDGKIVTLDLHGATVDEALDMTYRTLRLAEERGRSRLKLIHGSSTTTDAQSRTIKSALYDLLDQGNLGAHATNVIRSENTLILALDLTTSTDRTPIRLRDVQP